MPVDPFIRDIAHGFGAAILDPQHERPVKPEVFPTLGLQKASNILRGLVSRGNRRFAVQGIGMPIKPGHH